MKKIFIFICLVSITILNSCYEPIFGTGEVIQDDRNLSDSTFWAVEHEGIGNVYITQGSPQSVIVETDENLIDKVNTTVRNKRLTITTKANIAPTVLNIFITMEDISELKNTGSGNIISQNDFSQGSVLILTNEGSGSIIIDRFTSKQCQIKNEGSGDIKINDASVQDGIIADNYGSGDIYFINALTDHFDTDNYGSGDVRIENGSSDICYLLVDDSGDIDLQGFTSRETEAETNGSGDILISVTDILRATITGSGNIEYWGNPTVESNITGSGKLIKRN